MTHKVGNYIVFDNGTTCPCPTAASELEWKLRYAQSSITNQDMFQAAAIIGVYRDMVMNMTQKKRNSICEEIKRLEG